MKHPPKIGSFVVYRPLAENRADLMQWAVDMIGEVCVVIDTTSTLVYLMTKHGERIVRKENVQPYQCIDCRL